MSKCYFCGNSVSNDYEGRCGNCHKYIGEDEYCRYCGTKKCGSSVTCGENNDFSNIQGLQRATLDNEFITADDMDNVTQDKTPLAHFIYFYSMFIDGYTGDGKRAGGSHELIYNNDKRTVEEKYNFYGEGVGGGEKVLWCITVPTHIKFEEDLIEYIKSKKPEWESCLKSYQQKRKPVNPPLMGQIASFPSLKKDKGKTFDPPPLADVPVYHPPQDFDLKDNIMPCVYGSPKQMSGIYGKKKQRNKKGSENN